MTTQLALATGALIVGLAAREWAVVVIAAIAIAAACRVLYVD